MHLLAKIEKEKYYSYDEEKNILTNYNEPPRRFVRIYDFDLYETEHSATYCRQYELEDDDMTYLGNLAGTLILGKADALYVADYPDYMEREFHLYSQSLNELAKKAGCLENDHYQDIFLIDMFDFDICYMEQVIKDLQDYLFMVTNVRPDVIVYHPYLNYYEYSPVNPKNFKYDLLDALCSHVNDIDDEQSYSEIYMTFCKAFRKYIRYYRQREIVTPDSFRNESEEWKALIDCGFKEYGDSGVLYYK